MSLLLTNCELVSALWPSSSRQMSLTKPVHTCQSGCCPGDGGMKCAEGLSFCEDDTQLQANDLPLSSNYRTSSLRHPPVPNAAPTGLTVKLERPYLVSSMRVDTLWREMADGRHIDLLKIDVVLEPFLINIVSGVRL